MGSKKKPKPVEEKKQLLPSAPVERIQQSADATEFQSRADQLKRRGIRKSVRAGETNASSSYTSSSGQRRLLGVGL